MKALLIILALLPALASARPASQRANNWSRVTMHIPATDIGTTLKTTTGVAVTIGRGTSDAKYVNGTGSLGQANANEARVESTGVVSEDVGNNYALRSEEFDNAAWTKTNVTVTADSTASPWGASGNSPADTLAATVNGGLVETATGVTATANRYSFYVYARTSAGTQSFDLALRNTTAGADVCAATGQTATTTWQRFSCVGSVAVTATNVLKARIYPGTTASTGTIIAWGAQIEKDTADYRTSMPSSYMATVGSIPVTRNRENISVDSRLRAGDRDWCVAGKFTPRVSTYVWDDTSFQQYFQLGGNGAADSLRVYGFPNNSNLHMDLYDATATAATDERAKPGVGVTATMHICNKGGVLTMYIDGVAGAQTRGGGGTATLALSSVALQKLQIAGVYGNGSQAAYTNVQNIRVCRTADPSRCN